MRYKLLGRSGLRVSELCLGTMTFGEEWGFGEPREESQRVFERFVESGGNFIDTANRYTDGTSERIVGDLIARDRDWFVLATKYTLSTRADDPNGGGNHRKNMVQAVEASLDRLGTDRIDLYWLHAWDYTTPVDEVMRALDDLVRAGKVLHVGASDTPAWIVAQCNTLAELRAWSRFVAIQIKYNLIERTCERELLPMARALGLAVTPWAAIGAGVLTGKYTRAAEGERDAKRNIAESTLSEHNLAIAREVDAIADELGCSSAQVAINWLRQQSPDIIPILGARTVKQLDDNLGCLDAPPLSGEHLRRLEELSAIPLGFPHEFLASEMMQNVLFGEFADRVDRPSP